MKKDKVKEDKKRQKKETEQKKRKNPYSYGVIYFFMALIIIFCLAVTIGIFIILCKTNDNITACQTIYDLQAATLTVASIAIALVTSIISILTFFRERKTQLLNKKISNMMENSKQKEKTLTDLLFWQINTNKYLIGTQLESIKGIGNSIISTGFTTDEYRYLLIINSLLEAHIDQLPKKMVEENYQTISRFSAYIIKNNEIPAEDKHIAIFSYVNAQYQLFRNKYLEKSNGIVFLDNAIKCMEPYLDEILPKDNMSIAELHIFGLVYYWKAYYNQSNFSLEQQEILPLLNKAYDQFTAARTIDSDNIQAINDLGCCEIGYSKYYTSIGEFASSDDHLDKAINLYTEIKSKNPNYVRAYINLIDIECKKIKNILRIQETQYCLSDLVNHINRLEDTKINSIKKQIAECINLGNRALSTGELIFNIYYKMADIKIYELLISKSKDGKNIEKITTEIEGYIDKSLENKSSIMALQVKRQLYELLEDQDRMSEVNRQIEKLNNENAIAWDRMISRRNLQKNT